MKKVAAVIVIILGLGLVGFGVFKFVKANQPNAGLKIESSPAALVFINDEQVGQTPIEKTLNAGEITVKLVPNSTSVALPAYQTKVRLSSNVITTIRRDFGKDESESGGETITLEPQAARQPSLSVVVSGPDSASVLIDGSPQGFTPLLVNSIAAGDHQITVTAPGFATRNILARAVEGHKLVVSVKLAGNLPEIQAATDTQENPTATASATLARPYVEIKDTPTGFLRIRQQPSTTSPEIGQVKPNEQYSLLNEQSGWYQIKVDLAATSSGWISGQYATKVE